ncbi:migration and invasion-inhibitory protein isoform X5 [Tamandua tetradactyla]|uniref:migration and invasion-inhibitory protein isoform X5 n=1 Tax=Tamandua tetradactyla TaxID=48850 RepID=UPI004053F3B0
MRGPAHARAHRVICCGGRRCPGFRVVSAGPAGPGNEEIEELGLEPALRVPCGKLDDIWKMLEAEDTVQLRQLNLELLRQLWVGQDAVRQAVAEAAFEPRVTFHKESAESESSWCLGSDWTAGSLDSSSHLSSKSEAFFSKLQEFREANREECISRDPEPQLADLQENGGLEEDHECVYCYRVNRRLFLVPADPGTPCRLCRTPRGHRDPKTLVGPAQVRVTVPLSVLDPPHRYRFHRRKSFDASDTLALPRHCLLGWDVIPPKSEKASAPKSLDLWSSVPSEAQHRKLAATSPSRLVLPPRALPPSPVWPKP